MIMWTVLSWAIIPFMAIRYGVNGAAMGYTLVGLSSVIAIFIVKRIVNFSLVSSAIKPLVATLIMSLVLVFLRRSLPINLTTVWLLALSGVLIYLIATFSLYGNSFLDDVKKTTRTFFNKE